MRVIKYTFFTVITVLAIISLHDTLHHNMSYAKSMDTATDDSIEKTKRSVDADTDERPIAFP